MSTTKTAGKSDQPAHQAESDASTALAEAGEVTRNADEALTAARQNLVRTEEAMKAAEASAVETMASAALGDGDSDHSREQVKRARQAVDEARSEAYWASLHLHAMEVAHSRAAEAEAKAQRAVTAEEYLAAHREYNDPKNRENRLISQLTDTVAELITLINDRQQLHHRLAQEYATFPSDERLDGLSGKPITTYGHAGQGIFDVRLPVLEVAEAIKSGVAAAAKRP